MTTEQKRDVDEHGEPTPSQVKREYSDALRVIGTLRAELDAARAREVELTDAIDSLLSLITGETGENCDVQRAIEALSETRAQFEARILKRDAKLREALRETPCHLDCADFPREKWCLRCAALEDTRG